MSDADTGSMNEQHARHALGIGHSGADSSRKNAVKTRGRPFAKGNAGRPKGALNRTTLAAQTLLNGEAEALTRLCIDRAFEGDPVALKLCMERILPRRTELPVEFTLPPLQSGADLTAAMAAILQAVSQGKILLSQAVEFGRLLQLYNQTASARDPDDLSALSDEELRARILRKQAEIYDPQATLAALDAAFAEVDPTTSQTQTPAILRLSQPRGDAKRTRYWTNFGLAVQGVGRRYPGPDDLRRPARQLPAQRYAVPEHSLVPRCRVTRFSLERSSPASPSRE